MEKQLIKGFNMPYFFNQFPNSGFYPGQRVTDEIAILKSSNAGHSLVRYAGGWLGNIADSRKPGYGTDTEHPKAKVSYLGNFKYFITEMDFTVSLVANVYQAMLTTNRNYWIDDLKNMLDVLGNRVKYVELGNELNISGQITKVADKPGFFESKAKYTAKVTEAGKLFLDVAYPFYEAVKRHNPAIKVGFPMGNPFTIRNVEWNRVLRTADFNDTEIFHIYMRETEGSEYAIRTEIEKTIAGNKKPVCITEWGWLHGSGEPFKNLSDIGKKYYNTFFYDFPYVCYHNKDIEMICQHMLYGPNPYCVIKP